MQSDLSHDLSPPSQTIYEKVAIIERELIRSTCRLKTHVIHHAVVVCPISILLSDTVLNQSSMVQLHSSGSDNLTYFH